MTTSGGSPWPRWLTHLAVVGATLIAAVLGVLVAAVQVGSAVEGSLMCGPQLSEGTMIAPASWRARVVCTGGMDEQSLRDGWLVAAILGAAAVGALAVLATWLRRRSRRLVEPGLVAVLALPTLLLVPVWLLPADCTAGQWERYGAAGCERDLEHR